MVTLELGKLYAPVAADFERFEARFQEALRTSSPALGELIGHVARFRGKQLRPALLMLTARAVCSEVSEDHLCAAVAIELIHTATLVHDDVIDHSDRRRSLPTINARWGTEASVLLGDHLFATAYGVAAAASTLHLPRFLARMTRRVCRGEVNQLLNRGDLALDVEQYRSVIQDKTATLYTAATELGARLAGANEEVCGAFRTYGTNLGIAFQIADDILDLCGEEADVGKSLGTDLEQGTLTLPIIHALEHATPEDRQRLHELLANGYRTARRTLRELIEPYGSFAHARMEGRRLVETAIEALAAAPPGPARDSLMGLAAYTMERKL
jgi:octaprenyl-diphosphate synthase